MGSWYLPFLLLVAYHKAQGASVAPVDSQYGYYYVAQPSPSRQGAYAELSPTGIAKRAWRNPFATILGNRPGADQEKDRLDGDTGAIINVQDSHLLPDALIHQQFLKPQLEAQGFSGGHIVAGPFPVPLSKLPKPPQKQQQPVRPPTQYYWNQPSQQHPQPVYTLQQQQQQQASAPQPVNIQPYSNIGVKAPQPVSPRPSYTAQQSQVLYKGSVAPAAPPAKYQQYYSPPADTASESHAAAAPAIRWTYGQWTPMYEGGAPVPKPQEVVSDADLQNIDFGNVFDGLGSNMNAAAFLGNLNYLDPNAAGKVPYRRSVEPVKKYVESVSKKPYYVKPTTTKPDLEGESQIITANSAGVLSSKVSRLGQGSGRYVGRVLPAYAEPEKQTPAAAVSVNHDSTLSLSSVGYTLRFAPDRR